MPVFDICLFLGLKNHEFLLLDLNPDLQMFNSELLTEPCSETKWSILYSLFQARLFDEPQLASLCLENIDKNTGDALAAEGFTDIDLGNVALWLSLVSVFNSISLTDRHVFIPPCLRYVGGRLGEGYSRGAGGAFVRCFCALGRCRGSQAADAAHTREQTQSAGQGSHTHPLPSHDYWGICCR